MRDCYGFDDARGGSSLLRAHEEMAEALRNMFSRLKDLTFPRAQAPDLGDYEKIDPTVEVTKEISTIVGGPLATVDKLANAGASRAFGIGNDVALPRYRKISRCSKSRTTITTNSRSSKRAR